MRGIQVPPFVKGGLKLGRYGVEKFRGLVPTQVQIPPFLLEEKLGTRIKRLPKPWIGNPAPCNFNVVPLIIYG